MCLNKKKENNKEDSYMMIGEKRDSEEYLQAINTGHLVFTTIAQHNAIEAYKRLKKLSVKK